MAIYRTYGYANCGCPVRDNGGNRDVSRNASAMLSFAPHHVGNGFIRSARYGFAYSHRSRHCNKCIGISVNAQLKKPLAADEVLSNYRRQANIIKRRGQSGLAFFNGEYKEGELYRNQCLPYSILVTETTSPAMPARARTAQTAVQTAAS